MVTRKRLSPEESRAAALAAARVLLMEAGPQAVTLKAVASRIGRTHANLLHHFGSAAGLQKALAGHLAGTVCDAIGDAVLAARAGTATPRDVVNMTFDSFDEQGGGALASWMLASGNEDALDPIVGAIQELMVDLHPHKRKPGVEKLMHEATYSLVLLALGDALMGPPLAESLGVERRTARDAATEIVAASFLKPER
ncbi:TetR/AcrR family transcriptional regulator [Alteraurantiacibacter aquimixticola]|uniref:TetR family transcriptional regulator n=1 Tax=Alteraurantiacibacter aquimixticola TaxID=2489173 RepID=A0A4T3F0T4_9SPHN|nr:TetR family transcriptional regulator [Alteraurantiacibacter aquimixticola]TIX50554.1 TetR family transcriptional regulator [Alteraurantiacibacter aquimixticola]